MYSRDLKKSMGGVDFKSLFGKELCNYMCN